MPRYAITLRHDDDIVYLAVSAPDDSPADIRREYVRRQAELIDRLGEPVAQSYTGQHGSPQWASIWHDVVLDVQALWLQAEDDARRLLYHYGAR